MLLGKHDSNIYAANGIGAALAEMGDYPNAQRVFIMVSHCTSHPSGLWIVILSDVRFSIQSRCHLMSPQP
jgi:hypothetical protein